MKRIHVTLTQTAYKSLAEISNNCGVSKAKILRESIDQFIDSINYSNLIKYEKYRDDTIIGFNFRLDVKTAARVKNVSKQLQVSCSVLIRAIVLKKLEVHSINAQYKIKKVAKKATHESNIISNIQHLIVQKNWTSIHKNFLKLGYQKLANEPNPIFFIDTIRLLEKHISYTSPRLPLYKARLLWQSGNFKQSVEILKTLLNNPKFRSIKEEIAISLGEIYADVGMAKSSISILNSVLESSNLLVVNSNYKTKLFNKLGQSYFYIEDLDKVSKIHKTAVKHASTKEDLAVANRYIANMDYAFEDFVKSEKKYDQSFNTLDKINNRDEYSRLLITRSELSINRMKWDKALAGASKAVSIARKMEYKHNLAWALRVQSSAYSGLQDLKNAMKAINESISISKDINCSITLCKAYQKKGRYLLMQKRYVEAYGYMLKALALEKLRTDKEYNYSATVQWIQLIRLKMGNKANFNLLHKLERSLEKKHHEIELSGVRYLLGIMYQSSKKVEDNQKGTNILKHLRARTSHNGNTLVHFAAESALRYHQTLVV